MDRYVENQQRIREQATYRYLEALDSGDIDAVIEVLQQAIYDAPLEQMVLESHQAYFQEEQAQTGIPSEMQRELLLSIPLEPKDTKRHQRSSLQWMRVLAAVLIIGALVGSFVTLLNLRRTGPNTKPMPTAIPVCKSYPLKPFDIPFHTAADSINVLSSVTAISANDAWAVGYATSSPQSPGFTQSPFIEHWNGKSWQFVPSPDLANDNGKLTAVAATSANDVWAVGSRYPSGPPDQSQDLVNKTLIEHWDGKNWRIIPSPDSPNDDGILNALTVISQNDVWAVGSFKDGALLEHWNGTNWQVIPLQGSGGPIMGVLYDVAGDSANDVWAVGLERNAGEPMTHSLVEHWDGNQWQAVQISAPRSSLQSVSVLSSRNVWVVGSDVNGGAIMKHWDGLQWNDIPLPGLPANQITILSRIVAAAPDNIWAVGGGEQIGSPVSNVYLFHWDGKLWQQVHIPTSQLPPNQAKSHIEGLAIHGGRQLWIVGYASDQDGGYTSALIFGQLNCP